MKFILTEKAITTSLVLANLLVPYATSTSVTFKDQDIPIAQQVAIKNISKDEMPTRYTTTSVIEVGLYNQTIDWEDMDTDLVSTDLGSDYSWLKGMDTKNWLKT